MFTTDLFNLYNRNIFKTSLYIYIVQDEKCRLMRNLSLSMVFNLNVFSYTYRWMKRIPPSNLCICFKINICICSWFLGLPLSDYTSPFSFWQLLHEKPVFIRQIRIARGLACVNNYHINFWFCILCVVRCYIVTRQFSCLNKQTIFMMTF